MSKCIALVPLAQIARLEMVVTNCRKTMAEVKAETGADCILNGGMWSWGSGRACPHLMVDGDRLSDAPDPWWDAFGYHWTSGPDIALESSATALEKGGNFLSCTCLIGPWGPVASPGYDAAQGGRRGRSAVGIAGDKLGLYCAGDGTADASTPEELRDELHSLGWDSAVMLDGGGSAQCDFAGETITASRKVHNWICVWLKQEKEDKPVDEITSAIMTSSACWKAGRTIAPRGIMVHSTAAPGVMADSLRSAWDSPGADAAAHAIVDDTHTLQTLPWTCRGWHAGVGTGGGSANDTHIGFEICEPEECRLLPEEWVPLYRGNTNPAWAVKRLQLELQARGYDPKGVDGSFGPGCEAALRACQADLGLEADGSCGPATRAALAQRQGSCLAYDPKDTEAYFQAVWSRAAALCAKLCRDYGLDPMTDILCHAEGFRAGISSNHADVEHWFPRHGMTMDDFRKAVKEQMDGKTEAAADPEPWYAGDRKWVMEMGIADGTRPEEAATRAEVWAMLHRFAKGGS